MSRYFLEIKYDGTGYHGWQIQQNANSIQDEINRALSTILQDEIAVAGAGRTDAGVHAKQTFAHFDTHSAIDANQTRFKLNGLLPSDIACSNLVLVEDNAHARFGATERSYEYLISTIKDPFLQNRAYFFPHFLDINLMNEAAEILVQTADFSCSTLR